MARRERCGALICAAAAFVATACVATEASAQTQTRKPADPTQDPAAEATDSRPNASATDPGNPPLSTQKIEGTLRDHPSLAAPPARDARPRSPNAARTDDSTQSDSHSTREGAALPAPTQIAAEPAISGTAVVTKSNQAVGSVVETVFDSQGQPDFVVISAGESMTAVPYRAAKSMMSGEKLVIDRSRLAKAPKIRAGQWRESGEDWKNDSRHYWERG